MEESETRYKHIVESLRERIDQRDQKILMNLAKRQQLASMIQAHEPGRKADREQEIKSELIEEYPELEDIIHHLYDYLFERSCSKQETK